MKTKETIAGSLSPLGWALPKKHKEPKRNLNSLEEKLTLID
jgi:hypothetical protein